MKIFLTAAAFLSFLNFHAAAQNFKSQDEIKNYLKTGGTTGYVTVAICYQRGECGVSKNTGRAIELYQEAYRRSKDADYLKEAGILRLNSGDRDKGLPILEAAVKKTKTKDQETVAMLSEAYCDNVSSGFELEKCCEYAGMLTDFNTASAIYQSARCIIGSDTEYKVLSAADLLRPDYRADKLTAQLYFDTEKRAELLKLLTSAKIKDQVWAQDMLGRLYAQNWKEKDLNKAEDYLLKAARQDYYPALLHLGQFYFATEQGAIKKNALKWLIKSARTGNYEAKLLLSKMYYTGNGVRASALEFAKWAREAVAMDPENIITVNLCYIYYDGYLDLKPNAELAKRYCKPSAEKFSDETAMAYYGVLLLDKDKKPLENKEAIKMLEKSALAGIPIANLTLAEIYYQFRTASHENMKKAYMYSFACHKVGMTNETLPAYEEMEKALTPEEVEVLRHDSFKYSNAVQIYIKGQ